MQTLRARLIGGVAVLRLVVLAFAMLGAAPVHAQLRLTVNSTGNAPDIRLNGICETAPGNGICTLRAAIMESNGNAGADSIGFRIPTTDPGYNAQTGVYGIGITTELSISDGVQITGPGSDKLWVAVPDDIYSTRVINVTTGGTATLSGLTIALGNISGLQNLNNGTVNISNCVFMQNSAFSNSGGGAILNAANGIVHITNSTFRFNRAVSASTFATGGAIHNVAGLVTVDNSTFFQNQSGVGGAVSNANGVVTVTGSTFHENGASREGGALANTLGVMNVVNSTLYSNIAYGGVNFLGRGGAIYNQTGVLNLSNSTVTANFSQSEGSVTNFGTANVKSTIIAQNFGAGAEAFFPIAAAGDPDVYGVFVSQGFNLIGKRDGSTGFTAATDKKGTLGSPLNPKFDTKGLRNNGGPTSTVGLQSSSPAVDKGTSLGLNAIILSTDQRGGTFLRKVDKSTGNATGGDGTDIGAFEVQ